MMRTPKQLLHETLRILPKPPYPNAAIHLALSGGVDSSVSGLLLREAGWRVKPIVMRCWDEATEGESCWEVERRAAEDAARALCLKDDLQTFDFVAEYWTDVFDGVFLDGLRRGFTPNADLACNRAVKFGAFPKRLREAVGKHGKTPQFATGHYARVVVRDGLGVLLAGLDDKKDQSYFLSSVRGEDLTDATFPVGTLLKTEVREIARWAGLPGVRLRSSRGMCFVGKRRLGEFIERYMAGSRGAFVDAQGRVVGPMDMPAFGYTVGQRARVGGLAEAVYVVGRRGNDVVVAGAGDERLFSGGVFCERVDWVCGEPGGVDGMRVEFKGCSTMPRAWGTVRKVDGGVVVVFDARTRRIATGQAVVLYDGEVCLGAAWPVEGERAAHALREFVEVGWATCDDGVAAEGGREAGAGETGR